MWPYTTDNLPQIETQNLQIYVNITNVLLFAITQVKIV